MPLAELVDMEKEKARMEKELKKNSAELQKLNTKLSQPRLCQQGPRSCGQRRSRSAPSSSPSWWPSSRSSSSPCNLLFLERKVGKRTSCEKLRFASGRRILRLPSFTFISPSCNLDGGQAKGF
ncbi:MAG: hypothetical protein ACLR1K_02250 [Oscillospiraceae bacterium]